MTEYGTLAGFMDLRAQARGAVMGIAWLSAYAYVLSRMSALLGRAGVRQWLERVTGGVLSDAALECPDGDG